MRVQVGVIYMEESRGCVLEVLTPDRCVPRPNPPPDPGSAERVIGVILKCLQHKDSGILGAGGS